MSEYSSIQTIANIISTRRPNFKPKLGLILGSGLGEITDKITDKITIPYRELPKFHICSVAGHTGNLHLGNLGGMPIVCLEGRAHLYEGVDPFIIKSMIRPLKLLGCDTLFLTSSVGSLRLENPPGTIVTLKDFFTFQTPNPLIGENDDEFGPRFPSMDNVYDAELRKLLIEIATKHKIKIPEAVYIGVTGPSFETHAEIRAYQLLGGDIVGMSVVAETIIAKHCGLKIVAASIITNYAAGLQETALNHEDTLRNAGKTASTMAILIEDFCHELTKFTKQ